MGKMLTAVAARAHIAEEERLQEARQRGQQERRPRFTYAAQQLTGYEESPEPPPEPRQGSEQGGKVASVKGLGLVVATVTTEAFLRVESQARSFRTRMTACCVAKLIEWEAGPLFRTRSTTCPKAPSSASRSLC